MLPARLQPEDVPQPFSRLFKQIFASVVSACASWLEIEPSLRARLKQMDAVGEESSSLVPVYLTNAETIKGTTNRYRYEGFLAVWDPENFEFAPLGDPKTDPPTFGPIYAGCGNLNDGVSPENVGANVTGLAGTSAVLQPISTGTVVWVGPVPAIGGGTVLMFSIPNDFAVSCEPGGGDPPPPAITDEFAQEMRYGD